MSEFKYRNTDHIKSTYKSTNPKHSSQTMSLCLDISKFPQDQIGRYLISTRQTFLLGKIGP